MKFKKYLENPKIKDLLVVGGVQIRDQISSLNAGVSYNFFSSSSMSYFKFYLKVVLRSSSIEGLWSTTQGKQCRFEIL